MFLTSDLFESDYSVYDSDTIFRLWIFFFLLGLCEWIRTHCLNHLHYRRNFSYTTAAGDVTGLPSLIQVQCVAPGAIAVSIWVSTVIGLQVSFWMRLRRDAATTVQLSFKTLSHNLLLYECYDFSNTYFGLWGYVLSQRWHSVPDFVLLFVPL